MQGKCVVNGCNKEFIVKKHQLCHAHYRRYRRHGDPGDAIVNTKKNYESYLDKIKKEVK